MPRRRRRLLSRSIFMAALTACAQEAAGDRGTEGDDGGDGGGGEIQAPWTGWVPEGGHLDVGADAGLRSGQPSEARLDAPATTLEGHPIEVDPDGALRYSPPPGFWGPARLDYRIDDADRRAYFIVAPRQRPIEWVSASGRQLWTGWTDADGFGAAMVNAGDLDGDGDDDLVISAPGADRPFDATTSEGAVVFVPGRRDGTLAPGGNWLYGQDGVANRLGERLCAPGDVDGDGLADLWASSVDPAGLEGPRLHLIPGRGDLSTLAGADVAQVQRATIWGLPGGSLGRVHCGLRLRGDAASDLVFHTSANLYVVDGAVTGKRSFAAMLDGGDAVALGSHWPGLDTGDLWISRVDPFPDQDGDGFPELAVVLDGWNFDTGERRSKIDLVASSSGSLLALLGARAQVDALAAADLDADGVLDLVVASRGTLEVYLGPLAGVDASAPDLRFEAPRGSAIPRLQIVDVDGDGREDLVVSYPNAEGPGEDGTQRWGLGLVVLLRGGEGFAPASLPRSLPITGEGGFVLVGAEQERGFGRAGVVLADLDGDDIPELMVSAPDQDVAVQGRDGAFAVGGGAVLAIPGLGPPRG